jgi:hypothetical protein
VLKGTGQIVFFNFNTCRTFLDFSRTQYDKFLNSVLTTIFKMKPSFFMIFSKKNKILKISNGTGWFSISQQKPARPGFRRFLNPCLVLKTWAKLKKMVNDIKISLYIELNTVKYPE